MFGVIPTRGWAVWVFIRVLRCGCRWPRALCALCECADDGDRAT
jgi:hypothetical protein